MANALYDAGRADFLDANIDWSADAIHVHLCDEADYTVNLATDDFEDDVTVAGRVFGAAGLGPLLSKTSTDGTADAADITASSISGDVSESLTLFVERGGAETANELICNIDTATGLPVTPNGGDITIQWDSGSDRIFTL